MQPTKTKLSKALIMDHLYDGLMSSIDPRFMHAHRDFLVETMLGMDEQQMKALFEDFHRAIQEFLVRWPVFIEGKTKQMKEFVAELDGKLKAEDISAIADLEEKLSQGDNT